MEKISSTLKRIPEYKILLSSITVFIIAFLSICIYGFSIGGSYIDGLFIFYVIWVSLVVSFLLCLFMFGKAFFKRFYNKEYRERHIWGIICLLLIIIQFFFRINRTNINIFPTYNLLTCFRIYCNNRFLISISIKW